MQKNVKFNSKAMEIKKNFFSILSSVKSPESATREFESLPPNTADFLKKFNKSPVPFFVYSLFVSKFIHLINLKPTYQNKGRILLSEETRGDYSETKIKAILKLYFNQDDADCTVLFLSGHGTPKGDFILYAKEGEIFLSFEFVKGIWEQRTSKDKNKELFIIIDSSYSGNWVDNNNSKDIFIQASCSRNEKANDFMIEDQFIGSVFLHNFLMINGMSDCFYECYNQTPTCSYLKFEDAERVKNVLELQSMKKGWEEFKALFPMRVRNFNREQVIYEGEEKPVNESKK